MAVGFKTGGRVKGSMNQAKRERLELEAAGLLERKVVRPVGRPRKDAVAAAGEAAVLDPRLKPDPRFGAYALEAPERLVPYENNARTHAPEQIDLICKLITEYGFTNPVLTDGKRGILAGHGRVQAAIKLGMAAVPVVRLKHLSDVQRRAYILADNASAERAGWDDDLRRLELGALAAEGFNLELTGFTLAAIGSIFGPQDGLTDPDDAPPLPAEPTTALGDVWLLGAEVTCPHCQLVQPVKPA